MTPIAVLVISCDKYRDLWPPFFVLFRKHWPDCPFPVFLGANHETFDDPGVTTLRIGEDVSWTTGVRRMLVAIDCEYVITFLEDFLIERRVDTHRVMQLADIAVRERLGCLRLAAGLPLAFPSSRPVPSYPGLGILDPGELYRVSAQVSIWRRETLEKFLVPGANAWEFEVIGTALSNHEPDLFWAVDEPAVVYDQAIEKGKWKRRGLQICASQGVKVDLEARPAYTDAELERHYEMAAQGVPEYHQRRNVARAFRAGNKWEGLRLAIGALRRRPLSLRLWTIALFGVMGPAFLSWIELMGARTRAYSIRWREVRRSA